MAALTALAAVPNVSPAAESNTRYLAWLADGSQVTGDELSDWHRTDGMPRLQGHQLLEDARPLTALIDRWLPPQAAPPAFVELVTGDRLPGRVVGFRAGDESPFEPQPAHFLVDVDAAENPASPGSSLLQPAGQPLRVDAAWVRRIVWRRNAHRRPFEPQAAFLRDGGRLRYRASRFADGSVSLLLDQGPRRVHFDELAEIHFDAADPWDRLLDELAVLTTAGDSRLMQLETIDGLIVTASLERLRARTRTSPSLADQWEHGMQPAWSLDLIWIRCGAVRVRRMFAPHEVPLTRLYPKARHESLIGEPMWPHQVNHNARGGPLRLAAGEQGWGFGVHAVSELQFELPALTTHFRTRVGLDQIVGGGGCVQARVFQPPSSSGRPAELDFRTPLLIGSAADADTGKLPLDPASNDQRRALVLQVSAAHEGRPPGADPLDIRDSVDWGFPTLFLDPERLRVELARRCLERLPAWHGWQVAGSAKARRVNGFVETSGGDDRFEPAVAAGDDPLVFSRQQAIGPDEQWLVLNASHLPGRGSAPNVIVRIDDEVVLEQTLPHWQDSPYDRRPLAISLAHLQPTNEPADATDPARPHTPRHIQVLQSGGDGRAPVVWHGLTVSAQHPSLHRVFEEQGSMLADTDDLHRWLTGDDSFAGDRCLQLPAGETVDLLTPRPLLVRERPKPGECRFLRLAVRRQAPDANIEITVLAHDDREPGVYAAGPHEPDSPLARRLTSSALGDGWLEFTRDLFSDFGERTIRGLRLAVTGGDEPVRFDSVYLARVQNDLRLAAPPR